jgi:hypothetical protein
VAELDAVLPTVAERIARHAGQGIGEQDTKAALIVPVLRALGWDTENLEDVRLEYKRRAADNPVDYALVLLREPRLFIEAKSLGSRLDDPRWANQFLGYAMAAGVEWVALTDGDEYRLYNSHATVPVEEKLFRTIRISDPATRPAETLALISKGQLQDHAIDLYWKSEFVDRQVGDALRSLFTAEPDPSVVRLVHGRVPSLPRADVKASLGRVRASFDFPVIAVSAPRMPSPRVAAPASTAGEAHVATQPASKDEPNAQGEGTPWRHVTLGQLIDAGLVRPPLELVHRYKGTELHARIEDTERIVFDGVTYDSLSTAGGMARKSVVGQPAGRAYPQTNGWTFWEYEAATGSRRQLDALRRELFEGKVVSLETGRRAG